MSYIRILVGKLDLRVTSLSELVIVSGEAGTMLKGRSVRKSVSITAYCNFGIMRRHICEGHITLPDHTENKTDLKTIHYLIYCARYM